MGRPHMKWENGIRIAEKGGVCVCVVVLGECVGDVIGKRAERSVQERERLFMLDSMMRKRDE